MIETKTVTLHGQTFKIAPLTFAEVRDLVITKSGDPDFGYAVIAASLNNCAQDGRPHTAQSVALGLPKAATFELLAHVLEITGLDVTALRGLANQAFERVASSASGFPN
jgi:hypothetical protein